MSRYQLDQLGWIQFEHLCQSLLKAGFAVGIESWGGSGDHGRDAYFVGTLAIPDSSHLSTRRAYVFQAKFVSNANAAGARPDNDLKKAVRAELERIEDVPDCYVLMTNCPVTTKLREDVTSILRKKLVSAEILLWGEKDLSAELDRTPALRTAFPQLLGLRDLEFILLDAIRKPHQERAKRFIERAGEDAKTFFPTAAYEQTLRILSQHNMAVLAGPPEMGKTTTALLIGLTKAADKWECFECRTPDDFFTLYDAATPQFFVADDAFGTTEYVPRLAEEWAASLDAILRCVNEHHWFVWTSRTIPLERALHKMNLQGRAERFPAPGKVTINSTELSVTEKAFMLYRHARAAALPDAAKDIVKKHASRIVSSSHFTPKRVHRFVSEWLPTANAEQSPDDLKKSVDAQIRTPTLNMKKSLDALPDSHKRLLLAMLDNEDHGLTDRYAQLNLGESTATPEQIIEELRGHFLAVEQTAVGASGRERVTWTHPSWRDLVIDYLAAAPEERRRFLSTCGLRGLELALSSGGGREGERVQPLLVEEKDWEILGGRVPQIAEAMRDTDLGGALATITDAMSRSVNLPREEQLSAWARAFLRSSQNRWAQRSSLSVLEIEQYCTLSELISPLPPLPDLSSSWTTAVLAARKELQAPDWYCGLEHTNAWLQLIALAQKNEPRFLRQVDFPDEYYGLLELICNVTNNYIGGFSYPETHDEYRDELGQLAVLAHTCFRLHDLSIRGVSSHAEDCWKRTQAKAEKLDMQRAERIAGKDLPPEPDPPAVPSELIPTEKLFSDL